MRKRRPVRRERSSWEFAARALCLVDDRGALLVPRSVADTYGGSRQDGADARDRAERDSRGASVIRLLPIANDRDTADASRGTTIDRVVRSVSGVLWT